MDNIKIQNLEVVTNSIQEANTVIALYQEGVMNGKVSFEEFLAKFGNARTRPLVILVSGAKRSGKDFISEKILKSISDSKRFSFAEPLKQIMADTFNISLEQLDEYKNEAYPVVVNDYQGGVCIGDFRQALQRFGTEAMKTQFGNDVWVDLLIDKLEPITIVSDWRFKTEYEAVKKVADVVTLRVVDLNASPDGHISERDLDGFNYNFSIDNTSKDSAHISPLNDFLAFLESEYGLELKNA